MRSSVFLALLSLGATASALPGLVVQDNSIRAEQADQLSLASTFLTLSSSPPSHGVQVSQSKDWTTFSLSHVQGYKLRVRRSGAVHELCDPSVASIVGYFDVAEDKHLFFWLFESRSDPSTDPLVMWTNGGPGCSSTAGGLLMELGPCRVAEGGNGTTYNPYGWNNKANVIFIDHPVGVGWSYADGRAKIPSTSEENGKDLYIFFQILFQTIPELQLLDFHIAGESYAGHYIPSLAHEIVTQNDGIEDTEEDWRVHIRLSSVLIGNGITDALVQLREVPTFAEVNGYVTPLYPQETIDLMRKRYPSCAKLIQACYSSRTALVCVPASIYCASVIPRGNLDGLNPYDIRMKCSESNPLCYDILNDVNTFMNNDTVKDILGVVNKKFDTCTTDIGIQFALSGDHSRPAQGYVRDLLERGIRVLIYVGDADSVCDWVGNLAWIKELEWSGQSGFNNADEVSWEVNGRIAGVVQSYENLTFVRIFEAGHMVPYDQDEVSDEMVQLWLSGSGLIKI
ncbi:putative carboxypeptidase C [Cladochytrium replicatum]|nr:putative carboxypeptidase C [Cladochytrium replicatum]